MGLRTSMMVRIWDAIEKSPFTPADFLVENGAQVTLLTVTFVHRPEFTFTVAEDHNFKVLITRSPGEYKQTEKNLYESLNLVPDALIRWTVTIRDELRSTIPIYSELDELRQTVEDHIKEHVGNPQQRFTEEEAEELGRKLDELTAKFQMMEEQNELTRQEVERLDGEIENLKINLSSYPKGVWYKTAAAKIWQAVSSVAASKESRLLLAQAAQKMLGLG